jgi:hypothetical protein
VSGWTIYWIAYGLFVAGLVSYLLVYRPRKRRERAAQARQFVATFGTEDDDESQTPEE